jgi:hypothetical protein
LNGTTLILVHTIAGGVGLLIAGRMFGCRLHPAKAFIAAALSGAVYALLAPIPGAGGTVSLVVLVLLVGFWGTGDWTDAVLTTLIARGVVLIGALYWVLDSE